MDYIETPKEEYKKRFDLVTKDMSEKNNRACVNGNHYYGSRESCDCFNYGPLCYKLIRQRISREYRLKEASYDRDELYELAMLMYNRFCQLDNKSDFKRSYGRRPNSLIDEYKQFFKDFVADHDTNPVVIKLFVTCMNIRAYSSLIHIFLDFVRGDLIWFTNDTDV